VKKNTDNVIQLALHHRAANDNADQDSVSAKKRRAAKSGKRGEQIVADYNAAALKAGVACLHQIPTPTRWSPRGLRYASRSTVDFVGFLLDGSARFVAMEVKTCTSKKTFSMSEVEPHQREYLDTVHDAGGLALLTIVFGVDHAVCVIPWQTIRTCPLIKGQDVLIFSKTPDQYLRGYSDSLLEVG
jgi:penicillin-binding protein-related factor A (putative recombinase)